MERRFPAASSGVETTIDGSRRIAQEASPMIALPRLLLLAALLTSCGTRDRPRGTLMRSPDGGVVDATAPADSGPDEATDCLDPASCVDTTDCPSGSRCNLVLSPPRCQRLYCGGAGTACSESELCAPMHVCSEDTCQRCVDCGESCVLTQSDPRHCGGCDMPVRFDQLCENGQPTCAGPEAAECGDECVSIATNPSHCGGCNQPCSATCVSGECVELVSMQGGSPMSCTALCSATIQAPCAVVPEIQLPNDSGPGAGAAAYGDQAAQVFVRLTTCEQTPALTNQGLPYAGAVCYCRPD
jgi:hypothetical protein